MPKREEDPGRSSSSSGCFGGRGGGGGPGVVLTTARLGDDGVGRFADANLPASRSGGGARNLDWGPRAGDGSSSAVESGEEGRWLSDRPAPLRAGGGAGGGPRLELELPVS